MATRRTNKRITAISWMLKASSVLAWLIKPLFLPFFAYLCLFTCTYLHIMHLNYKLMTLSIVFVFTLLLPQLSIWAVRKIKGWNIVKLAQRESRFLPYILTTLSYSACYYTMQQMHFPRCISGIIMSCLICMVSCALINIRWKISTHVASCGLMVGGLLSLSFIFNFNPVYWLCVFVLLSGMLGTARMIVRQHTIMEIAWGFAIGVICGIAGILFI